MKKILLGLLAVISLGAQATSYRVGDVVNIPVDALMCQERAKIYEVYDAIQQGNKAKALRLVNGETCSLARGGKAIVQIDGDGILKIGTTSSPSNGGVWIFKTKDLRKD